MNENHIEDEGVKEEVKIERVTDICMLGDCVRKFDDSAPRPVSSRVASLDGFIDKLANHAENYCIAKDGEIVGFLSFYANRKDEAYLSMIAVDKGYRNMGLGTALLNFALNEISERGIPCFKLEVDKDNTSAIAFYRKHGFVAGEAASDMSIYMRKEFSNVSVEKTGTPL